jgi:tRNA threonylcarbamoyladenosine modification (KEOPS) complex Cgi121 subunit
VLICIAATTGIVRLVKSVLRERVSLAYSRSASRARVHEDRERQVLERVLVRALRAVEDERGLARVLDCLLCVHCAAFIHRHVLSAVERDARCGYGTPAALRALPTCTTCHAARNTVVMSDAGT